jgi:hypothetical protein
MLELDYVVVQSCAFNQKSTFCDQERVSFHSSTNRGHPPPYAHH